MLDTDKLFVSEQIEKRITSLESEKALPSDQIDLMGAPAKCFDKMVEHALAPPTNLYKIWKKWHICQPPNVLKLASTSKVKCRRNEGLRTPETSMRFNVSGESRDGERSWRTRQDSNL
ncbi:MAG: hypothetical protein AAF250_15925 [Pseudomonadota bacterium]